ncbi:MAG: hypothetical protein H6719_08725 [Sandaracinaceae bacterium]|nr:hypothetical protein [Sandaracinaceae bacterium]
MGLLKTRWETEHDGHALAVARDELTKGFVIEWDGVVIARRSWSWIGLGELHGTADVDGSPREIHVALEWGGLSALDGECTVTVDGEAVPMKKIA